MKQPFEPYRRGRGRAIIDKVLRLRGPTRKRPPRKGGDEAEFAPVEPHNPKPLSGGAAVELEFDS